MISYQAIRHTIKPGENSGDGLSRIPETPNL
jgi:hypothetical protein